MSTHDVPNQDWMRTGLAQSSLLRQIEIEHEGMKSDPADGPIPELWASHSDIHQDSHSDEHRDYNDPAHGHADQHNDVHSDEHVDVFSDGATG